MTGDLAVWLRAQLDNDEQTARAANWDGYTWIPEPCHVARADVDVCVTTYPSDAEYIARHDPAFTLADITAKKKLLAMYAAHDHSADADHRWSGFAGGYATATDQMLEALAQPYAGRPGWHNEWTIT